MEKGLGRPQRRRQSQLPLPTKTKMQIPSKQTEREEPESRHKLAPIVNCCRVTRRSQAVAMKKKVGEKSLATIEEADYRTTATEGAAIEVTRTRMAAGALAAVRGTVVEGNKQLQITCHWSRKNPELKGTTALPMKTREEQATGKTKSTAENTRRKPNTRIPVEAKVKPHDMQGPQHVQKTLATRSSKAVTTIPMMEGTDFYKLVPDNVTDLEELPELSSSTELRDPQQCTEYVMDIYQNLLAAEREEVFRITPNLMSQQTEVSATHRRVLVDWLIQVHSKFNLLPDTLHICMDIIDRILELVNVPRNDLQLVGITAMFLSCKYEEIYPSSITEFVFIAADTYTSQQIRQKEVDILSTLNYQLGRPNPLTFLRRYSKLMKTTTPIHNLAKYFIETCYVSTESRGLLPSQLAVGALVLGVRVVTKKRIEEIWNKTMENYTWYTHHRASMFAGEVLLQVLRYHQLCAKTPRFSSIREKYTSGFQSVATLPRLHSKLEVMAGDEQ